MPGMKAHDVVNKALLLGDNHFETGAINLAAGAEIKEGAFLKRGTGKYFLKVTTTSGDDAEEPVAILAVGIKNEGSAATDISIRACIDGKVRADLLNVDGTQATSAQIDLIRKYGIVPIYVTDVSRSDNQ